MCPNHSKKYKNIYEGVTDQDIQFTQKINILFYWFILTSTVHFVCHGPWKASSQPSQPSPAQPSPAQPSPAQPSPAQPLGVPISPQIFWSPAIDTIRTWNFDAEMPAVSARNFLFLMPRSRWPIFWKKKRSFLLMPDAEPNFEKTFSLSLIPRCRTAFWILFWLILIDFDWFWNVFDWFWKKKKKNFIRGRHLVSKKKTFFFWCQMPSQILKKKKKLSFFFDVSEAREFLKNFLSFRHQSFKSG